MKGKLSVFDDDGKEYKFKGLQNIKIILDDTIPEGEIQIKEANLES